VGFRQGSFLLVLWLVGWAYHPADKQDASVSLFPDQEDEGVVGAENDWRRWQTS
jgi:hypothetical protein